MAKYAFNRPALIPTLFIVCATVLLAGLGTWQLMRLDAKQQLIAQITQAEQLPAVASVPADAAQTERLHYRKGVFTGTYLRGKTLQMVGQKSSGYLHLVPMKLDDSDEVILVSLGWFPAQADVLPPEGVVVATGTLRTPYGKRFFSPDNSAEKNLWFYEDMPAIEAYFGVKLVPLVLDTSTVVKPRNDHLGYAITWFTLAFAGLVMFALYHRKKA